MVIVFNAAGNHSNRLFQAIHIEAFCIENKISYFNPSFKNMSECYGIKNFCFDNVLCFIIKFLKYLKIIHPLNCNDFGQNEQFFKTILSKRLVFVEGWCFRAHALTTKYQNYLVKKYSLMTDLYKDNDLYKYILGLDRSKYHIIGIHIRRGDYKFWENGKYNFTDDTYQLYMDNFSIELKKRSDKEINFILFSNENITINTAGDKVVSNNEWYIDQLIMSKCDYLIGPPSTFTLWASFIGKVKYYHITDNKGQIDIDKFSCCRG